MKKLLTLSFALMMAALLDASGNLALAQISDINSAINKAGRQRMLSQRMAKAYLQTGPGTDAEQSRRTLEFSVAHFDRQLVELKNYAPNMEIKGTYLQLESAWLAYKDVLIGMAPGKDGARKVMELSERVLELAHQGGTQFVEISGTESGPLVGMAGRQRMVSQRIAKLYQALAWGVAPVNAAAELDKSRREFNVGMRALSLAPATTKEIKDEIEKARQLWLAVEALLDGRTADRKAASAGMATASERLLDALENVTALFEKVNR